MVVLHVLAPAPFGGLERVVEGLTRGLAEQGDDVHVAVVLQPADDAASHPFVSALRTSTVTIHDLTVSGRAYLKERALVADLCSRLRPQVVHTHGYRSDLVAAPAARSHGVP